MFILRYGLKGTGPVGREKACGLVKTESLAKGMIAVGMTYAGIPVVLCVIGRNLEMSGRVREGRGLQSIAWTTWALSNLRPSPGAFGRSAGNRNVSFQDFIDHCQRVINTSKEFRVWREAFYSSLLVNGRSLTCLALSNELMTLHKRLSESEDWISQSGELLGSVAKRP